MYITEMDGSRVWINTPEEAEAELLMMEHDPRPFTWDGNEFDLYQLRGMVAGGMLFPEEFEIECNYEALTALMRS